MVLKTIWEVIKAPFVWIKKIWNKFEEWVASWVPGAKTRIVAGLGALGSLAAASQEWVHGLPLEQFVTAKTIAITSAVLFTLAFWLRGLGNRYS